VEHAVAGSTSPLIDDVRHDRAVLVAEAGGDVVGFVTVSHRRHFTGVVDASIDDLAVAEEWEGRGIASALFDGAEAWARERRSPGPRLSRPLETSGLYVVAGHSATATKVSVSQRCLRPTEADQVGSPATRATAMVLASAPGKSSSSAGGVVVTTRRRCEFARGTQPGARV
jgi:GNAT superfamily N-acetyltransferase